MRKHYRSPRRRRVVTELFISAAAILGIVGTIEVYADPKLALLLPLLVVATYCFALSCERYKKILERNSKNRLTRAASRGIV